MTEYIKVKDIISKNVDSYSKIVAEVSNKEISGTAESTDTTKMKVQCCRCRPDWFVVDGLGITCSGLTYILILFGEFVVIGVILLPFFPGSPWSYIHAVLFSCCAILAGCSHLRAMTTNPGTIPKGNFTDENVKHLGLKSGDVVIRCTRCECIKTERAHHCSTCQRCIRKMDHHCPWINNCVGEFNQKYFVLFTFYIMTLSAYAMALAIHYVFKCSDNDWKGCTIFSPPTTIIFIVFLLFEGLLFGLFTLIMFCTQINSVMHDETGIEHLKKEAREKQGNWKDRMKDTFGGDFGISWFSPFSSLPYHHKKQEFYEV